MAEKGNNRHIKSLASSKFAAIERKAHGRYMMKPAAGRHILEKAIPLALILTKFAFTETTSDSKTAILSGLVTVNGKTIREPKYPVGLNDVVGVTPTDKFVSVGINERGQSDIKEIKKADVKGRICRVIGKYKAEKNSIRIRLHDGTDIASKPEVMVNDSIILDSKNKVEKVLPLKKGSTCLVIDGVHVGTKGKISELKGGNMHRPPSAVIEGEGKKGNFETLVKNLMVIA
jgi:small subunit ribosomal protein S4e